MNVSDRLLALYRDCFGVEPEIVSPIPGSGSNRQYLRIGTGQSTVIGAFNADIKENRAFVSFTRSFLAQGLPVPEILAESSDGICYLLRDLGDQTLFSLLQNQRTKDAAFPSSIVPLYQQVLEWLPRFQVEAKPDYKLCYPRSLFDRQSMLWDLNYFKYYYLKLAGIQFDEQHLENDFFAFTSFLLESPSDFFMYRDFQSRNVMVVDDRTWFIDYQGGRRGALQYDLVSLLYDAKADIPEEIRRELLEFYLQRVAKLIHLDREMFLKYYPAFILVRILQAMGAYGFRGYYEKKSHFLQSIPFALKNLLTIRNHSFLNNFPELCKVVDRMIERPVDTGPALTSSDTFRGIPAGNIEQNNKTEMLTVRIVSFSYKKGYPEDQDGNGGGFVFDCRALPNPGRYEEYKQVNGMDKPVIDFLNNESAVATFLSGVFSLIDHSVIEYQRRGFLRLTVSFGCTGGQHRSVYCAEALAMHLKQKYQINIDLSHREQQ